MDDVWELAAKSSFAFRRFIDVRLAYTLLHHGVIKQHLFCKSWFSEVGHLASMFR